MELLLWGMDALLCGLLAVLLIKLRLMQKSADEIKEAFGSRLLSGSNTLIDISSRDRHMRALAESINRQLRILRKKRRRFEEGDRTVKEAITNISHDLRTPLTAVCGYLDLLEQEDLSENAARCISVIRGRTDNLKQLTEELFGYSLTMSAEQALPLEEDVLNRALEESILAHYAALKGRRISPEITMPKEPVTCRLNRTALFRILENMLCNAMKYSDGDLKITLTRRGEITFANHAKRLGEVDAQKLFDRLYTVETGTKSTGLGLSIARLLTEQMHGTASARYADGILFICLQFDVI